MNLAWADWVVTGICLLLVLAGGAMCRHFVRGVADFIVAGRSVRKYLLLSTGMAEGLGLISIASVCQEGFERGFGLIVYSLVSLSVNIVVFGIFGFAIMRYRELKVMTLPQFYEMRYSKGVRLTVGLVTGISGVVNMAIFPIVGAHFLKRFVGLPDSFALFGQDVSTQFAMMVIMLGMACFFAFLGGMVSVLLTDFIQSVLIAVVLIVTTSIVLYEIGATGMHEALTEHRGDFAFNPFSSGSYGWKWMLLTFLNPIPAYLAWAPNMQKIASVDEPKTAKLIVWLAGLMGVGRTVLILVWGIGALAYLGPEVPAGENPQEWGRYAAADYISGVMPVLIKGVALAGMIAAFISTVDSYLLTWASIWVNDVIAPLKKKPMSPRGHLWALRLAVLAITLFLLGFAAVYKPEESIMAYIVVTGSMIYGAGIAVIGGLYWKRSTTAAAYVAVTVCCAIPLVDVILKQIVGVRFSPEGSYEGFAWIASRLVQLESPTVGLIALLSSTVLFVGISLLGKRREQAVDRL